MRSKHDNRKLAWGALLHLPDQHDKPVVAPHDCVGQASDLIQQSEIGQQQINLCFAVEPAIAHRVGPLWLAYEPATSPSTV